MSTKKDELKSKEEFIDAIDNALSNYLDAQDENADPNNFTSVIVGTLLSRALDIIHASTDENIAKTIVLFEVSSKMALSSLLKHERNEEKTK